MEVARLQIACLSPKITNIGEGHIWQSILDNRQGTLANGLMVCDCRWKLGAETFGLPHVIDSVLQNSYSK